MSLIGTKNYLVSKILESIGRTWEEDIEDLITTEIDSSVNRLIQLKPDMDYIFSVPNFISGVTPDIYFQGICDKYCYSCVFTENVLQLMINFGIAHYLSGKSPVLPPSFYFKKFESGSVSEGRNYRRLMFPCGAPFWEIDNFSDHFTLGDSDEIKFIDVLLSEFAELKTHGEAMIFINTISIRNASEKGLDDYVYKMFVDKYEKTPWKIILK
jgi:hypothetical protein